MMTMATILLALLLLAAPAAAQPTNVVVSPLGPPDATGASFTVTWSGGPFPWESGYNDGSAGQQGTATSPMVLRMPYHVSGAATGAWLCLSPGPLAGCGGFTVPAKGVGPAPPPGPTTTHKISYREPTTNATGAPLANLSTLRAYWRIGTGPESMVTYPASGPSGGATRTQTLIVPATSGTLNVHVTAVNTNGQEGARSSPVAAKVIDVPPPPPLQFDLAVTATAGGVVSGTGSYPVGTVVSPKEAAATGFVFTGWSGACSGRGACSVTMDANKSVLATFAAAPPPPPVTFLLTMGALGAGIISPATGSYVAGTPVTLTATPGIGHAFLGWSGDPDCVDGQVTMSAPRSCTATFAVVGPPPPPPPGSRCTAGPTIRPEGWSAATWALYQQEVVNCRLLEELLAR